MIFKKIETYFYLAFAAWLLAASGSEPESVSINLPIISLNDIKDVDVTLLLKIICVGVGAFSVYTNTKSALSFFKSKRSTHAVLLAFVNQKLQQVTGSTRDRVSNAHVQGWLKPSINTGSWTSYKGANEAVTVSVPFFLSLRSAAAAAGGTVISKAIPFFIPLGVSVWLVVCI